MNRPVHPYLEQEPGWDDPLHDWRFCSCPDCDDERDRIEATEDPNGAPAWPCEDDEEDEQHHPDAGGDVAIAAELNIAIAEAEQELTRG